MAKQQAPGAIDLYGGITRSRNDKGNQTLGIASLGLEMGVAMAIGVFGGGYLDERFDSDPVFLFIGMALGIGAGVKALVNAVRKVKKVWEEDDSSSDKS